ncbi:UDP-N-acetylmuramate dehydrogenase [Clostridium ganghwense]|uniref:UDP-N-acetylenolpyruvoylglucosamine reductase n=1 Tax=Clostridium ganghwense TaxID=312089 RepID=A0ABT4CTI0_9CLOT|nr:UDP-N-acetylmuramate dehydrogenase [Clostridium ganghwense]MCY6371264.1 UDP-N-acetylmuramate dehydrogenase [Clostridium ganghwense]
MVQYNDIINKLKNILDDSDIKVNALMKDYTSFKVGGPADFMVTPRKNEQVKELIDLCRNNNIPYFVFGNGSNLIVRDGGFRGIIINLSELNEVYVEGEKIVAQSGVLLSSVSKTALKQSLKGLEFASGIPGSIGGAVAMNAGAYQGEISQVIESAVIVDKDGNIKKLSKDQLELSYRMSAILKYGYIVLEATFKLEKGDHDTIKDKMDDLNRRRREKQPLEYPSAGSTFKRPVGYFAGKLIQDSDLKGTTVGGAEVSTKHSGFIINKSNATAKDILELIEIVQKTVKKKFNVDLNTEVRIIGEEKNN